MKYYLDYDFSLMGGDVDFSTAIGEGVKVDIPNCPVTLPQNGFSPEDYQGIFTYAKKFDVDFDPEKEKVYLVFDAAMVQVHVFLNGVDLGNKPSGYVEARFDISQAVRKKDNELRVVLSSKEDPAIPPFGKALDYMTFAGLYRPVHVDVLPKTHIEHIRAFAHMDGTLEVKVDIVGDRSSCRLVKSLYDGNTPLSTFEEEKTKIEGIVPWDLDNPNLYTLKVSLESPFGTDERETRIGFRDAAFKDDGFHLNGKRMKLVGLNRHQTYPYVGPAMPDQAQRDDATILKEYGIQIVRTSHYPQSEAFLDACDELGILVVDEVPGWQYTGHDKPWRDNFLHFVDAMVDKEINHPSLVLYGVRIDEGQDDDVLYEEANRICRQKDPYRQTTGVRNFKNSHLLEDVYGFNDFGGGLIKKSRVKSARNKPYFVSEHNGHVFPTKIEDNQQKRIDHAYNHLRVLEDLFRHEGISASVGWCAFDYNTHCDFGSGDQICYHGVFDINRNPKPAAYAYRMQTAKEPFLYFARPLVPGDTDDALIKHVVLFTNLDYVKFYRGDSYIGTFYPDRKTFPNLPHPPIVLDNFMGEMLLQEGLSQKDALKIGKCLSLAGSEGFRIKKRKVIPYIPVFLKNLITGRLSIQKIVDIFFKYMLVWGEKAATYKVVGYKDDKPVIEKEMGSSSRFLYEVRCPKKALHNRETYDVARIQIRYRDEFDLDCPYIQRTFKAECSGPVEIVGPRIRPVQGGYCTFYVRSRKVNVPTPAKVVLESFEGKKEIEFMVD